MIKATNTGLVLASAVESGFSGGTDWLYAESICLGPRGALVLDEEEDVRGPLS